MSKALTIVPDSSDLATMDDPAKFILTSCRRAKQYLALALASDSIEQVLEMKSQGMAMKTYAQQRKLGEDTQLAATEIVRRAERCLGLAVRVGQKTGKIRRHGNFKSDSKEQKLTLVSQFVGSGGKRSETYELTDGVTDEKFEEAITSSKAEKNLSRSNLIKNVRKATKKGGTQLATEKRRFIKRLKALAKKGATSAAIADELGFGRSWIKVSAKRHGIDIRADKVMGASQVLKPDRVLCSFVKVLESLAPDYELIDLDKIDRKCLVQCDSDMDEAMRPINLLRRRLKSKL